MAGLRIFLTATLSGFALVVLRTRLPCSRGCRSNPSADQIDAKAEGSVNDRRPRSIGEQKTPSAELT